MKLPRWCKLNQLRAAAHFVVSCLVVACMMGGSFTDFAEARIQHNGESSESRSQPLKNAEEKSDSEEEATHLTSRARQHLTRTLSHSEGIVLSLLELPQKSGRDVIHLPATSVVSQLNGIGAFLRC